MADIGAPQREVEFEPVEVPAPVEEPVAVPEPAPPQKVPVPA